MKKIVLIIIIAFSFKSFSQSNELNVGVNGGITVGNLESVSSGAFGVDANYLFELFNGFSAGPSLNFVYFLTDEVNGFKPDAFMYLPIGAAVRFQSLTDRFFVGADFGFAIGISPEGDNGGIFFKPMVGYDITESIKINLFYSGIKKRQPTYGYAGIGLIFDVFGSSNQYSF
ncbi:hypothetical protein [Tenacibaculum jejuense]|uniref:Outer membrane protein beta-barrel domain-containing protein n=1 Tax=Tenacibaculum jejuense TaxID=584609 RepID=A0A238U910_9FLAO|nr:hypothetical protein [Tenacibaculum jejuense]SNR15683.1 conserved exported protein of unknown function [Tenacibaculum jejuense]